MVGPFERLLEAHLALIGHGRGLHRNRVRGGPSSVRAAHICGQKVQKRPPPSWGRWPAGRGRKVVIWGVDAAAGRRGGQAVSFTIVAIWPVELVANGCSAGRGVRIDKRPPADGVILACATRDTRRLVPPGLRSRAGIGILSGCGPGRPLLPLPSLASEAVSRCPAFGSCRPRALRPRRHAMWAGRDWAARYAALPAGTG
jgi:hypothetical protein